MNIVDVLPRDAISSIDSPTFGTEYIGSETDDVLVIEGSTPWVSDPNPELPRGRQ